MISIPRRTVASSSACGSALPCRKPRYGDDFDSAPYRGFRHGKADPHALLAVLPIVVRAWQAKEERLTGHDDDATDLQPLVQLLGGDAQALEPRPEEHGATRLVQSVVEAIHGFSEGGPSQFHLPPVEWR